MRGQCFVYPRGFLPVPDCDRHTARSLSPARTGASPPPPCPLDRALVRVLLVLLGGALASASGATTAIVLYEIATHALSWELPALVAGVLLLVLFAGVAIAGLGLLLRGARGGT
jgi:hypothetical protein